jgi:predicted metal-binding protein
LTQRTVENNSFVPKKPPLVCCSSGARVAHGMIAFVTMSDTMTVNRMLKSLSVASPSEKVASFTTHLTAEQLECLSRCARGISIRFEKSEIVDALVASGYAEQGVAGVVTVTAKGQQYLQAHAS